MALVQIPTPGAGLSWSLLNAGGTTLSGSNSVTVSGISGKEYLMIRINAASAASASDSFRVRFNGDSGNNYFAQGMGISWPAAYNQNNSSVVNREGVSFFDFGQMSNTASSTITGYISLSGGLSSGMKSVLIGCGVDAVNAANAYPNIIGGIYSGSAPITSFTIYSANSFNFDAGTVYVYGA
jgi:hypothetical protein